VNRATTLRRAGPSTWRTIRYRRFSQTWGWYPKEWADAALRTRILARRLAVEPKGWRPDRATARVLARLLAAIEAARIPGDWEPEVLELAAAIATAAGLPFAGPLSGETGPSDPSPVPRPVDPPGGRSGK
jgi:hypothetical protein